MKCLSNSLLDNLQPLGKKTNPFYEKIEEKKKERQIYNSGDLQNYKKKRISLQSYTKIYYYPLFNPHSNRYPQI